MFVSLGGEAGRAGRGSGGRAPVMQSYMHSLTQTRTSKHTHMKTRFHAHTSTHTLCACARSQVEMLVDQGKAAVDVRDRWDATPLDNARAAGAQPVIEYLEPLLAGVKQVGKYMAVRPFFLCRQWWWAGGGSCASRKRPPPFWNSFWVVGGNGMLHGTDWLREGGAQSMPGSQSIPAALILATLEKGWYTPQLDGKV